MKAIVFILPLILGTLAVEMERNQHTLIKNKADIEVGGDDCCGAENIDKCEFELLRNYKDIDIDRHIEMLKDESSVTMTKFTVTVDASLTTQMSEECQGEYLSDLYYIGYDNQPVPVTEDNFITVDKYSTHEYVFQTRLVDVDYISKYSVNAEGKQDNDGETDVVELMVEIKKLNGEVIRKHYFRVFIHVNDDTWDTQTTKGTIGRVEIFKSDEQCDMDPVTGLAAEDSDGECRIIVDYKSQLTLYKSKWVEFTETDELTIGDPVFGKLSFIDPSVKKCLDIEKIYFNPECCDNEDHAKMTELVNTANYWMLEQVPGYTTFKFLSFKEVEEAEITVVARIINCPPVVPEEPVETGMYCATTANQNQCLPCRSEADCGNDRDDVFACVQEPCGSGFCVAESAGRACMECNSEYDCMNYNHIGNGQDNGIHHCQAAYQADQCAAVEIPSNSFCHAIDERVTDIWCAQNCFSAHAGDKADHPACAEETEAAHKHCQCDY